MQVFIVMKDYGYDEPTFVGVYTSLYILKREYPDAVEVDGPNAIQHFDEPTHVYFKWETK